MPDISAAFGSLEQEITTDTKPRCNGCGRLLAEIVTRPWLIRCSRCKEANMGFLPYQEQAIRERAAALPAHQSSETRASGRTEAHRGQSGASSRR